MAIVQVGEYSFQEAEASILGRGEFGCVFRGVHRRSRRPVAVKRLLKGLIKKEELNIIRSLDNDHIVRVYDILTDDKFKYVVMELCDCTLEDHLDQGSVYNQRGMRLDNLNTVLSSLARGYLELYRRKILHGDIKPQNILVVYRGLGRILSVKLSDFGASRLLSDDSRASPRLAGTPLYMAPEIGANILDASDYDSQADMWSIGVVLYQCLVGQVPFDEASLCRLFLFAANKNYAGIRPPKFPQDSPSQMTKIIRGLLQVDARKRITPPQLLTAALLHRRLPQRPIIWHRSARTSPLLSLLFSVLIDLNSLSFSFLLLVSPIR